MWTSDRPTSNTILTFGLGYLIKYFAYYFLTGMVLLTFAILLAGYLNSIGPEMPFLEYFSFILPKNQRDSGSWGERDLMRLYSFISTMFFLLSIIGKWIILLAKRLLRPNQDEGRLVQNTLAINRTFSQILRRILINGLIITAIHTVSFFVFPFATLPDEPNPEVIYVIFAVFYLFAMMANIVYVLLDTVSQKILDKAITYINI